MIDKKKLLRQFALPTSQTQAFQAIWRREQDLFGDGFELQANINDQSIELNYLHSSPGCEATRLWHLRIVLGLTGRAKVECSVGIEPPVSTIHRARAIMANAVGHLRTSPRVITKAQTNQLLSPSAHAHVRNML